MVALVAARRRCAPATPNTHSTQHTAQRTNTTPQRYLAQQRQRLPVPAEHDRVPRLGDRVRAAPHRVKGAADVVGHDAEHDGKGEHAQDVDAVHDEPCGEARLARHVAAFVVFFV